MNLFHRNREPAVVVPVQQNQGGADGLDVELSLAQQTRMLQRLHEGLALAGSRPVQLIETHISFVLVAGERAYKFKKALRNSVLDQSTLAARRHACAEELRLNRRLAPDLYLDVIAVTGTVEAPRLEGSGPTLDLAVMMQSFDSAGLWSALAQRGALTAAHTDGLLAQLVAFHATAERAPPHGRFGTPSQVRGPMLDTLKELHHGQLSLRERSMLARIRCWEADQYRQIEALLVLRHSTGHVRECHGDLHLGNVAQVDGKVTVFDGIDFSDDLRWIDVMSELAFMAMDLHAHGLAPLAHRLVNAYVEATGDHEGLGVLSYYLVYRALVRAKVALQRLAQGPGAKRGSDRAGNRASRYLATAQQFTVATQPALLVTHGLSGSGKTTHTQSLLEILGAIRVRSDVERKRLADLPALAHGAAATHPSLYGADATQATYARLAWLAVLVLQSGRHVILDATFLKRAQRDAARALAAELHVPCKLLDFEVPEPALRARLRLRAAQGADASDADETVLDLQLREAEALQPDETETVFRCIAGSSSGTINWAPLLKALAAAP